MIKYTNTQNIATLISSIGVPLFIGLQYSWWMGVISFVLGFILNSLIGWFSLYYLTEAVIKRTYIPYLKMLIITAILIGISQVIVS